MRCEGFRREYGAFMLGIPPWRQCENDATVKLRVKQGGKTRTFPACQTCWNESVDREMEIVSAKPIRAAKAEGGE